MKSSVSESSPSRFDSPQAIHTAALLGAIGALALRGRRRLFEHRTLNIERRTKSSSKSPLCPLPPLPVALTR